MQREYKLSVVGTRFSENELITANYKYRILRNTKEIKLVNVIYFPTIEKHNYICRNLLKNVNDYSIFFFRKPQ